uniref:Uncharacterized protein n=1 Tax=Anguilla anguilla TaxID=7936 RepID=A0A0E9STL4_ANGAN
MKWTSVCSSECSLMCRAPACAGIPNGENTQVTYFLIRCQFSCKSLSAN